MQLFNTNIWRNIVHISSDQKKVNFQNYNTDIQQLNGKIYLLTYSETDAKVTFFQIKKNR